MWIRELFSLDLWIKALIGAGVVVVIQLLAKTKHYYIAGLAPLFPTFTLISHYIVGTEQTSDALKTTIRFGMFSLIPYVLYLVALYFLVDRVKLAVALSGGVLCWGIAAAVLILVWK